MKTITLQQAKNIADLLASEQLNEKQNIEAHETLRAWAKSLNMLIHITDAGAVYAATDHDLRISSDTWLLA